MICDDSCPNLVSRFARDARWSETGDRYVIKLFRDYVFHQVDANKNPITSLAHVMTCLNKLDAGSDERILLIARDDQSCIVATYKEIKAVVEAAFRWAMSFLHDFCQPLTTLTQRIGHRGSTELNRRIETSFVINV
jgi:hypothetical protein